MSDRVAYVDRFAIHEDRLEELRGYATEIGDLAKERVPGVVSFHYYVDDARKRGTALIVFADAAALDRYLEVASPHFQQGMELVHSTDVELLGEPSSQAAEVATTYGGRVMRELVGFDR